jgi:iron complex outermembrane receptor protein
MLSTTAAKGLLHCWKSAFRRIRVENTVDTPDPSPKRSRSVPILLLATALACNDLRADDLPAYASFAQLPTELRDFNVSRGPPDRMIEEFAEQAEKEILARSGLVDNVRLHPVSGRLPVIDALTRMLSRTGLACEIINDHVINIVRRDERSRECAFPNSARRTSNDGEDEDRVSPVPVVVFGSIDRTLPPGVATIASYVREDIDRRGDFTVESLLRTQPQVFGGGATEDTSLGREARSNASLGYGINLRGLDAGETLVLLNGRRMAPSGAAGSFVDVSNIPLTAVKRIDLLPPAAEAQYGADGAGGMVNFTMRDDFTGAQAEGRIGAVTKGSLKERQGSLLLGTALSRWGSGNAMFAFEYEKRDSLPAAARSQATSNFLPWGGQNNDIPFGNPGNIVAANKTYPIPHGQNGETLFSSPLSTGPPNTSDRYLGATVLPSQRRSSLYGRVSFEPEDHLKPFVDVLVNERAVGASAAAETGVLVVPPQNPFLASGGGSDSVQVLYGFGPDLGPERLRGTVKTVNAAAGLSWDTPAWHLSGYFGYTLESEHQLTTGLVDLDQLDTVLAYTDSSIAFNPFGDGSFTNPDTLALIRAHNTFNSHSRLKIVHLDAEHDLATLRAGSLRLATGFEHRDQVYDSRLQMTYPLTDVFVGTRRTVESGFAQLRAPFFGPDARPRWLGRLELSAAIRLDHYSDTGKAFSPTYGLVWSPVSGVLLRSSWSRSYKPPNLPDRVEQTNVSGITTVPVSANSSRSITALAWAGNNAGLAPERSRTWTVGGTLEPTLIPDSSVALTYFDILFRDKIDDAALSTDGLANPALDGRVISSPSQELRAQACQYAKDPQLCMTTPIDALIDLRLQNTTVVRTRGIDLLAKFDRAMARGNIGVQVDGTYLLQYAQSYASSGQLNDLLNTQNNPVGLRLHTTAHWRYRDFEILQGISYMQGYRDTATVPASRTGAWITTDLNFSYAPHQTDLGWASGMTLSLGVQNLFDRYPPFLDNRKTWIGYDQENGDLLGRFVSMGIRKNW